MKKLFILIIITLFVFNNCSGSPDQESDAYGTEKYRVTYICNNLSNGSVPVDSNVYEEGDNITIANPGDMARTDYYFLNWNTKTDGTGTAYNKGDTIIMPAYDLNLYAQWTPDSLINNTGWGIISGDNITAEQLTGNVSETKLLVFECGSTFVYDELTNSAQKVYDDSGSGSSVYSEALAMEVLGRLYGAVLLKTETEINYVDSGGIKTDFLVDIQENKIGITVTRAVSYPMDETLTLNQANDILVNKLEDIQLSTANVSAADLWEKQFLIVFTTTFNNKNILVSAVDLIDTGTKGDTLIIIIQTEGDDVFIY